MAAATAPGPERERAEERVKDPTTAARMIRNVALTASAALFLWLTLQIDLLIFAGLLVAVFLGKLARLTGDRCGLPHGASVAIVVLSCVLVFTGVGWLFAQAIVDQMDQLSEQLPAAIDHATSQLEQIRWLRPIVQSATPAKALKAAGLSGLFGLASNTFEIIIGLVVIAFVGLYVSAESTVYGEGLLHLVPPRHRVRTREILAGTVDILWSWLLGRLFSMAVIGLTTAIGLWLMGMAVPLALGMLSAILTFIPYLGSIASGIPAVLIALTVGTQYAVYVVLLYTGVHSLEGYVLVPLVQRRAAHLPPALTLSAQVILGSLAGLLGVALATPLTAGLVSIVRMAYVEDVLGDRVGSEQVPRTV